MVRHQQIDQAVNLGQDMQGRPVTQELFHRVMVDMNVRPEQQRAVQAGAIFTFARQGPMTTWMLPDVPLGYPVSLLSQAWRESDIASQVKEVIEHQTVILELSKVPRNAKGDFLVRNGVGNWVETELMRRGADAEVLKSISWDSLLGQHPMEFSAQELEKLKYLPVPEIINQKMQFPDVVRRRYRSDVADFLESLIAEPGLGFAAGLRKLCNNFPQFNHMRPIYQREATPWPGMWSAWHFKSVQGRLFRVRDTLLQRLAYTDIERGFPASFVHSPYPDCYFTLQTPLGTDDGTFRVLGFYVSERRLSVQECAARRMTEGSRAVSIVLVHQEIGLFTSIEGDAVEWAFEPNDTTDFITKIDAAYEALLTSADPNDDARVAEHKLEKSVMLLACKVLLYVSLKNARLVERPQRSALLVQARKAKGREKDRLWTRAHNTVDYIDVGPEEAPPKQEQPITSGHSDRTMPPHWRRGYYRPQAYGPGRSERRTVWIEPVLVRADRLTGGDEPPKPDYIVH